MKIILKGKDCPIDGEIENYLQKKLSALSKFLKNFNNQIIIAEVELGRTTRHHQTGAIFRAEINLKIGGQLLRAESEQEDLYTAIDLVRDQLEEEIKKFKSKRETIFKRGARSIKKNFGLSPLARFK